MNVLVVCGTRPEVIKMAPLLLGGEAANLSISLCVTGQHRQMLDQPLSLFQIVPDYDLNIMQKGQDLSDITAKVLLGLRDLFESNRPDVVLVHGDTTTTLSAALASFYANIPVMHVEAGLRTGNILSPWPEEANRKLVSGIASRHYAPTKSAERNLINEGVSQKDILVTGNTVIDALKLVVSKIEADEVIAEQMERKFSFLDNTKKLILVTGHRRENFGDGFERICLALKNIATRDDVQLVYPVHLNPNVAGPVQAVLSGIRNVHLIDPLGYLPFVYLMKRCHFIITDSGGIQEEAPALGKPVLVTRDTTERPEAVTAGTVLLVGTDTFKLESEGNRLLDDSGVYEKMSVANNPYGDGHASETILGDLHGI